MKIFSTPSNLHFLYFDQSVFTSPIPTATLKISVMPTSQPDSFATWCTEVDVSHVVGHTLSRRIAANILATKVAFLTRRAPGNILFVPDHDTELWFQHTPGPQFKYVIDYTMQPNELRCTYWKLNTNKSGAPSSVDGGVQFFPNGFSCVPNYKDYFTRCFL